MKFDYYEKDTLFCNVAYSQFDSNLREAIAARRKPDGSPLNRKRPRNVFSSCMMTLAFVGALFWVIVTIVVNDFSYEVNVSLIVNIVRGIVEGIIISILYFYYFARPKLFFTKVKAECIGFLFIRNGIALMLAVVPVFKYVIDGQEYISIENTDRRRRAILPNHGSKEKILVSPSHPSTIRWRNNFEDTYAAWGAVFIAVVCWILCMVLSMAL